MELLCAGELLLRVASSLGSRSTTKAGDSISVSLTYLSVEVKICSAHSQYRSSHDFFFFPARSSPYVATGGSAGTESEVLGVFQTRGCQSELCFGGEGKTARGELANRAWL